MRAKGYIGSMLFIWAACTASGEDLRLGVAANCDEERRVATPESLFAHPPPAARPQTWWHWMNGNVTKAGVTADLEAMARIGLGVACVTEEFSLSGLSRGVIVPLKTDFEIPPRAVTMCTLQGVTPTSAANRFMDFITETNRMAYDPGHSYHFTNS